MKKKSAKVPSKKKKYWMSPIPIHDDFGEELVDIFIDGKTKFGPWGIMTPNNYKKFGIGVLGLGFGQKYQKQPDGKWLKIEG